MRVSSEVRAKAIGVIVLFSIVAVLGTLIVLTEPTEAQSTREQKEDRYYRLVLEAQQLGEELGVRVSANEQRFRDAKIAEDAGCPIAARMIREQGHQEHPRQQRAP